MSSATRHQSPSPAGEPDLRLPEHRLAQPPVVRRGPAMAVAGVGVVILAALYLLVSPLIAIATGIGEVLMQIRDTARRPRPFRGARHGLPFLDRAGDK